MGKRNYNDVQPIAIKMVECKAELDRLGLHASARLMDAAIRKYGWERADQIVSDGVKG